MGSAERLGLVRDEPEERKAREEGIGRVCLASILHSMLRSLWSQNGLPSTRPKLPKTRHYHCKRNVSTAV